MDLIVSWLLFPALLIVLCSGCGLVVELVLVGGRPLPTSLLPVAGLAVVIVLGTALMVADATAELAAPACAALALAGFATAAIRRRRPPRAVWAVMTGVVVFAIYAAPIVLSGEATVAGFIKLDDTATWLGFTDRISEHGRDLGGLAPSTYEATLAQNLGKGYPVGALAPLAVGSTLAGVDPAWLVQPYMAVLATILAFALWALAAALRDRPGLRFAAAVIGAQPALLFGYYLWGGVKEVLAAALLAALAGMLVPALRRDAGIRALLPAVIAAAALLSALSAGGAIWLIPLAAGAAVVLGARAGAHVALVRGAAAVGLVALPLLLAGIRPLTSSSLFDDSGELGNLGGPLDPMQVAGIWGAGDFRFQPAAEVATYLLATLACLTAAGAVVWALRRRDPGPPLFVLGVLAGCLAIATTGSPWVDGKALATASVAVPFAAMLGAGVVVRTGRAALGAAIAIAVAGGVLWSNALAYRDVSLAPRGQLEDLERIGELVAGAGPTLITEYSPYGARHFLRDGDPESISDLRRRKIPLAAGKQVPKGESADTDRIDPGALSVYRSLVVRRSPAASRPPSAYELTWAGAYYELWQRRADTLAATERIGLGSTSDPVGKPECERVRRLASEAPPGAVLVGARRPAPIGLPLSRATYPDPWVQGQRDEPRPVTPGMLEAEIDVPRAGEYELWLGGSVRPLVESRIDRGKVGEVRHELNNDGAYVSLGSTVLARGPHTIEVEFHGPDLAPGSDGYPEPIGPLALSTSGAADARLVRVAPDAADRLCGRAWDWVEVAASGG